MKNILFPLRIFLLILFAFSAVSSVSTVSAQTQNDAPGPKASIFDVQKWLIKSIAKNSVFRYKETEHRTVDAKFDLCRLSYTFQSVTVKEPATPDISKQKSIRDMPGTFPVRTTSYMWYSFELKDMNPANMTSAEIPGKMTEIRIWSLGSDKKVDFNARTVVDNQPATGKISIPSRSAALIVKTETAEAIKTQLARAIDLCR